MFYNYPSYDSFRFEEPDEVDGLRDVNELYELETRELPPQCPYRQFLPPIFPFMGTGSSSVPTTPPPSFTPTKPVTQGPSGGPAALSIDHGALRPCTNRFIYIWPRRGMGFWAYLTYVGRRSAAGFRWNGQRWIYFGIDLRRIESFHCY